MTYQPDPAAGEDIEAALEEAAHAVACLVLGIPFTEIALEGDSERVDGAICGIPTIVQLLGVAVDCPDEEFPRAAKARSTEVCRYIIMTAAGWHARAEYLTMPPEPFTEQLTKDGSGDCNKCAFLTAWLAEPGERFALAEELEAETFRLVRGFGREILAVTHRLLECGRLDFAEVRRVFLAHRGPVGG